MLQKREHFSVEKNLNDRASLPINSIVGISFFFCNVCRRVPVTGDCLYWVALNPSSQSYSGCTSTIALVFRYY